eukprot:s1938_g4.t1
MDSMDLLRSDGSQVQLACGPSVSGVATPLANNSRGSSRGPLRQGLKDAGPFSSGGGMAYLGRPTATVSLCQDRLHGIHNSIYQVLGVLESYGEDEDSVLSNNDGGGCRSSGTTGDSMVER